MNWKDHSTDSLPGGGLSKRMSMEITEKEITNKHYLTNPT